MSNKFVWLFVIFCVVTKVTAYSLVLDSYTENGMVMNISPTSVGYSYANGTSILGGQRDMILKSSGSTNVFFTSCSDSLYSTSSPTGGSGTSTIQYDGYDNSPQLNPSGLGGIDLTRNGMSSLSFDFSADEEVKFSIYIYSGSNSSYCYLDVELYPQYPYIVQVVLSYYEFTTVNGGCKFNNVGAIVTVVTFGDSTDVIIGPISFTNDGIAVTPSGTTSPTRTHSQTPTATRSSSHTGTVTRSSSQTSSASSSPSPTPSMHSTTSRTPTARSTPSATSTKQPFVSHSRTPTRTVTPHPTTSGGGSSHGNKVIVIDTFYDSAPNIAIDVPANPQFPISRSSISNGTNIIGHERDLELYALSGYQYDEFSVSVQNDFLNANFPYYARGKILLQYDGTDHSLNLSPNGLNFDGTSGGANSFYFEFYGDNPLNATILVYSGSYGSYCTSTITTMRGSSAYVMYYYNFYNYGCSFSDIGAIELEITDNTGYVGYFSLTGFYTYAGH